MKTARVVPISDLSPKSPYEKAKRILKLYKMQSKLYRQMHTIERRLQSVREELDTYRI